MKTTTQVQKVPSLNSSPSKHSTYSGRPEAVKEEINDPENRTHIVENEYQVKAKQESAIKGIGDNLIIKIIFSNTNFKLR